jgi:hypothetical protein
LPAPQRPVQERRPEFDRPREDYRPREVYTEGPPQTNGKAIASLVLGIVSLFLGLLVGILALIFGILANKEINRTRDRQVGQGFATAGIVLGIISFVTSAAAVFLLIAVVKVREAAERAGSQNNLKLLSLATINCADSNAGRIPDDGAICTADGRPLLSWRVAILPFLDESPLFRQFHLNEPWDSEHNRHLITQMPRAFAHPGFKKDSAQGLTYYRAIVGPDTAWAKGSRFPASITDGTGHTILVVEAEDAVPWTKPDELIYDPNGPLPRFSKYFKSGFQAAMWDGSVRSISPRTSEATLRAACTARAGDFLGPDW